MDLASFFINKLVIKRLIIPMHYFINKVLLLKIVLICFLILPSSSVSINLPPTVYCDLAIQFEGSKDTLFFRPEETHAKTILSVCSRKNAPYIGDQ